LTTHTEEAKEGDLEVQRGRRRYGVRLPEEEKQERKRSGRIK